MSNLISRPVRRRTLLKAGLAIGAMQVASPFVVKSLADDPVKIGLDNPRPALSPRSARTS
jgi:hypothetical protein